MRLIKCACAQNGREIYRYAEPVLGAGTQQSNRGWVSPVAPQRAVLSAVHAVSMSTEGEGNATH